jgi:hypothetical protein
VVPVTVVRIVDVEGTVVVPRVLVVRKVVVVVVTRVGTVVEKRKVVNDGWETVVVYVIDVDTTYVVMFAKVNVKVKLYPPAHGMRVVLQVVTITSIGLTAGAFAGTRTPSAAKVTQTITRTLITSCLFKSVPSRC